ncbi:UDP-N-acetyl-alpha-D-glucosamine C6 dehydratase [Planctomycetes bacterium CA13]|uniref:UDP-N-acetyl-alpha-D-glucosamine C6 dehydratase n=1 Tax=Novipirellula herctigrandis TaxID=2527986 RepID=A0A5C5Z2K1_9BACT|nr:UDP-N-acetyl-alpha-D-glucosamine C6 dehydratase [Planctomycetes bacterium CA13]
MNDHTTSTQTPSAKKPYAQRGHLPNAGLQLLPDVLRHPAMRLPLLLVLHTILFTAIYAFAYFARFNFELNESRTRLFWSTIGPVVLLKLVVFYFGSHFHGWWRYVTFADLRSLLKVSLMSMVSIAFVDYFFMQFSGAIPRLAIVLDTFTTILVIGGLRSLWRFADESFASVVSGKTATPAILIGTGHRFGQLASQINSNPAMPCRVKALLGTDSDFRRKAIMGGVPVMGHISDVVQIANKIGAVDILVPSGSLGGKELRKLIALCNEAELTVRVLPRFEDAMSGGSKIPLRPLDIKDLLKRDPVQLDTTEVAKLIAGKRVLVTGAGGSIGSEICRQLLNFNPGELSLLGRGENRIHAILHELAPIAEEKAVTLHVEIGDITDHPRMDRLYRERQPEIVFHAAAHKHVPLMEMHPGEAVKNNIGGTQNIASLADQYGVGHFVMVSTDKAVNPTSVMGCTKHLAERVVYDLAQSSHTKFAVVRFGNVLGSAGSVIPRFQEQIRRGGPITITDERMTRYFMSIPEASQLVLQSASMCQGGEIFVLDMGDPVRIVQLAEDLVTLSGLPPGSIEFDFVGVRPGEKLYEELYFDDEATIATSHPKVRAAYASDFQDRIVGEPLDRLLEIADLDRSGIFNALRTLVPSYHQDNSPSKAEALATSENQAVTQ